MAERIIWAIDPFSDKAQQLKTGAILKALTKGRSVEIEPVAVLSPDQLRMPARSFETKSKDYEVEASKILQTWLKGLKIPGLLEPRLLLSKDFSIRASVEVMRKHSESTEASLIAMNTRSRKGVMRFLLGSFAETLLLRSRVPLLVVNPQTKAVAGFKEILFPTDLSDASKSAFEKVLNLAAVLKAKVIVYHKLEYVLVDTYSALHKSPTYEHYLEEDAEKRLKDLESWEKKAKDKKVKIEIRLDKKAGFITDAIQKASRRMSAGFIAMSSHSSATETLILGSVARQLLRGATSPIWVLHEEDKA